MRKGESIKRARLKDMRSVTAAPVFLQNIILCSFFSISFLMKMLNSQPKWKFYLDAALVPRHIAVRMCSQESIEA